MHGSDDVINKEHSDSICSPEYIDIPYRIEIEEILLAPKVSQEEKEDLEKYLIDKGLNIIVKTSEIKISI